MNTPTDKINKEDHPLAKLIRKYNKESLLSRPQLAKRVGVKDPKSIYGWENGLYGPEEKHIYRLINIYIQRGVIKNDQEAKELWELAYEKQIKGYATKFDKARLEQEQLERDTVLQEDYQPPYPQAELDVEPVITGQSVQNPAPSSEKSTNEQVAENNILSDVKLNSKASQTKNGQKRLLVAGITIALLAIIAVVLVIMLSAGKSQQNPSNPVQASSPSAQTEINSGLISSTKLPTPRGGFDATMLGNQKVLVAGGKNLDTGNLFSFAELYDPQSGIWTRTGNLNTPRVVASNNLVALKNGKALLAGGTNATNTTDFSSAELYDPETGQWSQTGALNTPRRNSTLTVLKDGRVLAVGGARGLPDGNRFLSTAELYDPQSGTWSYTGNLAVAREGHQAVLLNDGRVLVGGGEGPWKVRSNVAEIYDPVSGTWSSAGATPWGWAYATLVVLKDGRVLLAGGVDSNATVYSSAAIYDPDNNKWASISSMSGPRVAGFPALLPDGRVLVAGGGNQTVTINSTELYDAVTGKWTMGPNLPANIDAYKVVALSGGRILFIAIN